MWRIGHLNPLCRPAAVPDSGDGIARGWREEAEETGAVRALERGGWRGVGADDDARFEECVTAEEVPGGSDPMKEKRSLSSSCDAWRKME